MEKKRCAWVPKNDPLYQSYHDNEWGKELRCNRALFELLMLEGMQAGLSWRLILHRREDLRAAFHQFDPEVCAHLTDRDLGEIAKLPGVIRNRKKIEMVRANAKAYLALEEDFSTFIWSFVGEPIVGEWSAIEQIPCESPVSHAMAKELKKRGFVFVGPKICYSFMQAAGLANDHTRECFCYNGLACV